LGIALDIGTMMTASVAMGVCVDDTIHFANWFRRATRLGLDRRDATLMAYEHAAGAIYQSTAIVALGLLTFALSTFVPTRRFGLLMFTLLGCGLIADLTLPPVIMAGWLGKYFTRGCERGGDAAQHEEDVELLTRRDLQMK
jgi:predicted RND superfamily exporter protein